MTLTQYLDLAYSVIVDERIKGGMSLFDALDDTKGWAASGGGLSTAATAQKNDSQPKPTRGVSVEQQNDEALQTLMAAMSGIGSGGFG